MGEAQPICPGESSQREEAGHPLDDLRHFRMLELGGP